MSLAAIQVDPQQHSVMPAGKIAMNVAEENSNLGALVRQGLRPPGETVKVVGESAVEAQWGAGESVAIVANSPAPYRTPVFDLLPRDRFQVIYCARREPSRLWPMPDPAHNATFLKEGFRNRPDGVSFVHNNPDVWRVLSAIRPDVVVISGLNPTHLYSLAWGVLRRARLIYMTDGTIDSESALSWRHRLMRRLVLRLCKAFLVASSGGVRLLESYGINRDRIFLSRLCAPPPDPDVPKWSHRPYDLMFCGRIHRLKMPGFFVAVCQAVAARRESCRVLVVGDGPERTAILASLEAAGIDFVYVGFVAPAELRRHYMSARLLLFPTLSEPWGLVANEAMASGTPVITVPGAGCVGDLVIDGVNGRVATAEVNTWADAVCTLLDDPELWSEWSHAGLGKAGEISYQDAARGILDACSANVLSPDGRIQDS